MQDQEIKTSKKTLAIVGFVFGVLTVIVIYLVIK
jgi:asparagine N-glycosylation enzyme membrane subunit Stt3